MRLTARLGGRVSPMDAVTISLLIVSLLLALGLCLPRLLIVLGCVRLQNGFQAGPEEVTRYWLHDIDEHNFNRLTGLGFAPVGIYWEQMGLSKVFLEFVFAKQGDCEDCGVPYYEQTGHSCATCEQGDDHDEQGTECGSCPTEEALREFHEPCEKCGEYGTGPCKAFPMPSPEMVVFHKEYDPMVEQIGKSFGLAEAETKRLSSAIEI